MSSGMTFAVDAWQPPVGAVRDAELDAWEVADRDANGTRDGEATLYRNDGSVLLRCRYQAGVRSGPFSSYHPNGDVESEGSYAGGALDGTLVRYTSDAKGAAPLRSCCVPPGARKLEARYQGGAFLGETFYDASGRALRSDGTELPARPTSVPREAQFEENEERWVERRMSKLGTMLRRSYDMGGRLVDEMEIEGARRLALREYHPSGALAREYFFDDAGLPHGECLLRYGDEDAPYEDRAIREVRGVFEHGQAAAAWRFLDARGKELRSQERGPALSDEALVALVADEGHSDAAALKARAEVLFGERRVREALFLWVRAAAREKSVETLVRVLARAIVPLERGSARSRAAGLDQKKDASIREAFDSLLAGADAAMIFRLLATLLPATSRAALEFVEVSLLLEPENLRALVTRALVRLEQGDDQGALADAGALGAEYEDVSREVRDLARVLFRRLEFMPTVEPVPAPSQALAPVGVEQPLEAVRRTISLYATRLHLVRAELCARFGGAEPSWLPRDPSFLLGGRPEELRTYDATIVDDDEQDGSTTSEVRIDETLELSRASVLTLMSVARADWDALSWLCWSVGLDEVAQPSALVSRPEFPAAANEAILRCYRSQDQVRTAGLVSRSRAVPGFDWEGFPVDALSSRLALVAARQYLERRAMFLWLLFPQNLSPFQSDLRTV